MAERRKFWVSPELQARMHIWERVFELLRNIVRASTAIGIAWIVYLAIKELAGQTTVASFLFAYFNNAGNGYLSFFLPWILTALCCGWAWIERRFRYRKTEKMTLRIQDLERLIDPNRKGSNLMPSGQTNPIDRG